LKILKSWRGLEILKKSLRSRWRDRSLWLAEENQSSYFDLAYCCVSILLAYIDVNISSVIYIGSEIIR
jgi:hypothetical protein